jgi:hypothetical protein
MTLPLETRPPVFTGTRPRRVMAGELMVSPTERLVLKENGKSEELVPGRDRLCRDHPLVRKNPEWFRPADPKDFDTYRYHRRLLENTRKQLLRGTTTRVAAPRRFQLREGRRERFRLR